MPFIVDWVNNDMRLNKFEIIFCVNTVVLTIFLFLINTNFLSIAITDYERRGNINCNVTSLLDAGREDRTLDLPFDSICLFDPKSVNSWLHLKLALNHFGRMYSERVFAYVNFFCLFYGIYLLYFLLVYFGLITPVKSTFTLYLFSLYDCFLVGLFLALICVKGAKAN